ncbi:uncharacterized protein TNCV_3802431 [Trichonephila clavipes]|nr:uncharacterized protein TNCV_3802431 [Trichonephila clavipes]
MIVGQALADPTVTRSTIRADVGVAIVPQTISRHLAEANLKSKRLFRALPFNTGTSATASTLVPSQMNVERHRLAKGPSLNGLPGAIFQQDNALPYTARVAQDFPTSFSDSSMAGPLPQFVPCRARVGSAKMADAIV